MPRRDDAVIYVCGGDGLPPGRVLRGLADAGARVITVYGPQTALAGDRELLDLARELGPVFDVGSLAEIPTLASQIDASWRATPVLALSDDVLVAALELGNRLGWFGMDARLADLARHKYRARLLLAEAGISGTEAAWIQSPDDVDRALAQVGVPGVVKPVYGAGSCWVFRIDEPDQLREAVDRSWAEMSEDTYVAQSQMATDTSFVYERLIRGVGPRPAGGPRDGSALADYCSVEGIVSNAAITILGVSDRFVQAEPYRETGLVFPSCRPGAELVSAVQLAGQVIQTLEMRSGAFHIELKFTESGPVVIECNPRPGGPIPHMWERLTGRSFAGAYLRALHGDASDFSTPLRGACGEHLLYPAGVLPGAIRAVVGRDDLLGLSCVEGMEDWLGIGELSNPDEGDYSAIGRVWSWAADPLEITRVDRQIRTRLRIELDPAPAIDNRTVLESA